jgi:hypothetical protein
MLRQSRLRSLSLSLLTSNWRGVFAARPKIYRASGTQTVRNASGLVIHPRGDALESVVGQPFSLRSDVSVS